MQCETSCSLSSSLTTSVEKYFSTPFFVFLLFNPQIRNGFCNLSHMKSLSGFIIDENMKKLFYPALFFFLLIFSGSAFSQGEDPSVESQPTFPVLTFDEVDWVWGEIEEGDTVKHTFSFTNTGDAPLIITRAKGSCSCTKGYFSQEAIKAGQKGWIRLEFDTKDKDWGKTDRNLLVFYNGESSRPMEIKVIGEILKPKTTAPKPDNGDNILDLGGGEKKNEDENGNTLFKWDNP